MEKLEHQPKNHFANIRIALIVIAVVSFPFNLIGIFTYNAQTGSINQIVALSSSGLSSIIWLYWYRRHHRDPALSKPTGVILIINDLFFAIYLIVIYLTMLIVFGGIRRHVVCVYGNLACLLSALLHAYTALTACIERYKAYLARSQRKTVAFCPGCSRVSDYNIMDGEQEAGVAVLAMSPGLVNVESEPLIGGDSPPRYPFRASEDTASAYYAAVKPSNINILYQHQLLLLEYLTINPQDIPTTPSIMDILHSILSCLTGSSSDNKPKVKATSIRIRSDKDLASEFLTTLLTTDTTNPSLKKSLDETIHPYNWTSTLAQTILHGLENAIRSGSGKTMGKAATDALVKATHEAYDFAKAHPIYTTILALGVLAVLAPWVLEVLGFGELGPIQGSFAAYWQSLYGDVPAGAVFGYLQRMGMVWH
ncbi:hypothetical protein CNMCM5793_009640 [Aspergillus hiratsukae]|uniref:Uncharacterized protein n=1 Tax=Aspergillus hiratsukae TaxID=1194566 RepID=A0A8H6P0Q0_9EURO|nr:hypothetical protein CNMCM5793_009640 [Aspergillus hiratsukae]KAF7156214.1 hypothetical protein CNMCM6106_009279 [Aspergillus hiratsukae]